MTRYERVRYEMLLRIRDFGTAHRELFPESLSGGQAFATVSRAIKQIDTHAIERLTTVVDGHRTKVATRTVILERMRIIARTSKGVWTAAGPPLKLPMPARSSDVAVIIAARSFLNQAEAHYDQFASLGLPAACLAELREATEAFDAALANRRAGRSVVAAARAGIKEALALAIKAARTLDIVVLNTVEKDPVLLAAWERGRTIVEGKRQGRARGKKPVSPVATTTDAVAGLRDNEPLAGEAPVTEATDVPLRRVS